MNDYVLSLVRTWVPVAVGAVLSWLAGLGLDLGKEAEVGFVTFLTAVVIAVYYALARALEKRWPALGRLLLGSAKAPAYAPTEPEAVTALRNR
jgi:hypothetical protein